MASCDCSGVLPGTVPARSQVWSARTAAAAQADSAALAGMTLPGAAKIPLLVTSTLLSGLNWPLSRGGTGSATCGWHGSWATPPVTSRDRPGSAPKVAHDDTARVIATHTPVAPRNLPAFRTAANLGAGTGRFGPRPGRK